jgi:hypothetical protein
MSTKHPRATCPVCHYSVSLLKSGKVGAHVVYYGSTPCRCKGSHQEIPPETPAPEPTPTQLDRALLLLRQGLTAVRWSSRTSDRPAAIELWSRKVDKFLAEVK